MSAPYQAAHARERVPLPVRLGRWRTVLLLAALGPAEMATRPHEPVPDLLSPGTCNACRLPLDGQPHRRGRPRKLARLGPDPVTERGWR